MVLILLSPNRAMVCSQSFRVSPPQNCSYTVYLIKGETGKCQRNALEVRRVLISVKKLLLKMRNNPYALRSCQLFLWENATAVFSKFGGDLVIIFIQF